MTRSETLAVVGASGFIGSALLDYGQRHGSDVTPIVVPRILVSGYQNGPISEAVARWCRTNQAVFDELCSAFSNYDVVINAAGDPRAASTSTPALKAANVLLPAIVARAAGLSGVRRMVHISSAAVQGRLDPLDETHVHSPLSPYAASKAQGEQIFFEAETTRIAVPSEVMVYRPTSVQASGHQATRGLARAMHRLPVVPVVGSGEQPVPVALLENVVAGILFAATMGEFAPIVLQPSEGMTTLRLAELFGARRTLTLPTRATSIALEQAARLSRRSAYGTSRLRWIELMTRGQDIKATVLMAAGFNLAVGFDGWEKLAREQRRTGRDPCPG